jgi:acyl-homoserine-lactone acylase
MVLLLRRITLFTVAVLLTLGEAGASPPAPDTKHTCERAQGISITRDDWGIAHVHGKTDADAVFGMIYTQAEDDFNRIETNYLTSLGRLAERDGETALYQDLRQRLFISEKDLKGQYADSPKWLKSLMTSWADGLNCYLRSHPSVQTHVINEYEPWMALSFSEGSIGGDIEQVELDPLRALYGTATDAPLTARLTQRLKEPSGSNGIAIGPQNTLNHHALLLINPHTSFYFRSELQMTSDEGLNAYGAVTWGQFFIYQGFNAHVGWMHTSSGVDNVDHFLESVTKKGHRFYYRYGQALRPVTSLPINLQYRTGDGALASRHFMTYRTHHGPIINRKNDGHWISIALMQKPVEALSQSFLQTKAHDYASYMAVMELKANSSNNTLFASADGDIAYLHPQFIPKRDGQFDYTHPVDGTNPTTDWQALHALSELPSVLNPPNGWLQNTNNWPYSVAGPASPKQQDYPRYMDTYGENLRGLHAQRLLTDRHDFSIDALNAAAFDSYLPAFEKLIPALIATFDGLANTDTNKAKLADPIAVLRTWDYRWSIHSVATSLAVLWGDQLWDEAKQQADEEGLSAYDALLTSIGTKRKMDALLAVTERLNHDFGTWRVPWGSINRFQRLTGDIVQPFRDSGESLPVGFTSGRWGSLASFGAHRYDGTDKYYGTSGNSFVAIVEFGDRVRARAITAGGESGDPHSVHFGDQTARYTDGALRDVYFYPEQLTNHTERLYHPE